jgi:hypothetical protein
LLKQWLYAHVQNPYPDDDEKDMLATCTRLTVPQINNWFVNARRRILRPKGSVPAVSVSPMQTGRVS